MLCFSCVKAKTEAHRKLSIDVGVATLLSLEQRLQRCPSNVAVAFWVLSHQCGRALEDPRQALRTSIRSKFLMIFGNFWRQMPTKWLQERTWDRVRRAWWGLLSLEHSAAPVQSGGGATFVSTNFTCRNAFVSHGGIVFVPTTHCVYQSRIVSTKLA